MHRCGARHERQPALKLRQRDESAMPFRHADARRLTDRRAVHRGVGDANPLERQQQHPEAREHADGVEHVGAIAIGRRRDDPRDALAERQLVESLAALSNVGRSNRFEQPCGVDRPILVRAASGEDARPETARGRGRGRAALVHFDARERHPDVVGGAREWHRPNVPFAK